jgi:hypothetical protein
MEEEITIYSGIRGTRKLAAAFATLMLRKRGLLNKYIPGQHKTWTSEEEARAKKMRASGMTYPKIGAVLGRNDDSVRAKIGRRAA